MTPRKFKIMLATFSYGGNGGMKSEHPDVRDWMLKAIPYLKARPDIESVESIEIADTPITMTRNRAVMIARKNGADFLVMIDSDMSPDLYVDTDPEARPFLESSLDYCIQRYDRGPNVVFSPYGGPPPFENPYVFRWRSSESGIECDCDARLEGFTREEAAERRGLEAVAAGPTGLILYDMRAFELIEPKVKGDRPWFSYEWKDIYCTEKGSTEDVQNTRDISLAGIVKLGYNPIICNWDAWSGHWKPKCVGKPYILTADQVGNSLARAVAEKRLERDEKFAFVDFTKGIPLEDMAVAYNPLPCVPPPVLTEEPRVYTPSDTRDTATFTAHNSLPSMIAGFALETLTPERREAMYDAVDHGAYTYDAVNDVYERVKKCTPSVQIEPSALPVESPSC